MDLVKVCLEEFDELSDLAISICKEYYPGMVSEHVIEYFCEGYLTVNSLTNSMNEGFLHYFAVEDGQKIGFCSFEYQEDCIYVGELYIIKEKRGKGYGLLMLDKIISMKSDNNIKICLKVSKTNTNALEFYKKHGFIISGEKCTPIGRGHFTDDYVLERII